MQRPQYLALELAKHHSVIYVEPTVILAKQILRSKESSGRREYDISPTLRVCRLNGVLAGHRALDGIDPLRLGTWWERRQVKQMLADIDLVWTGYCGWLPIIENARAPVVYDKMDENALLVQNNRLRRNLESLEAKMQRRADLIFVTAQVFEEQLVNSGKPVFRLPNAVARNIVPEALPRRAEAGAGRKKVFGYIGVIGTWFDMGAIMAILEADPNNKVVLVGPCHIPKYSHPRLEYREAVTRDQLAKEICSFDICLYPFAQSALLDTIEPVKIYEYLAFNRPVLTVSCRETKKYGKLIHRYDTVEELSALSIQPLAPPFGEDAARRRFIDDNCWEARGAQVEQALQNGGYGISS